MADYWLLKTEPSTDSSDDLAREKNDGVRRCYELLAEAEQRYGDIVPSFIAKL